MEIEEMQRIFNNYLYLSYLYELVESSLRIIALNVYIYMYTKIY